ncbi:MAG: hypothetical protein ACSHWU_09575 [Marinicella sp.]
MEQFLNLSTIGMIHTLLGLVALISGFVMLWRTKQLSYDPRLGKIYLLSTLITAGSSLAIFNHGSFNVAHGLGVLTILAVFIGISIEKTKPFKSWNKYAVNLCYSATILFHLLPTTTEIMTRFPVDSPWVSSLKDPLLHKTFLIISVIFLVLLTAQMFWLKKQDNK